jgi:glycerol-3-phosphate dehydrogenase
LRLRARVVINATGVFADRVCNLERQQSATDKVHIAPSRGTHVVLPAKFLNSDHALMIPETDDGRVLFAIPWMGHTLLGTTDVATQAVDREPQATTQEIDYMLEHAARYLQQAPQRSDVLSVFSGLRPLMGKPNGGSTSKLSREHQILVSAHGLISIIGGKWTTFRKMGRDVVELAAQVGKLNKRPYQTPALSVANVNNCDEERLDPELPICRSDIVRAVDSEMAVKLQDVLSRRTRCLLLNATASQRVAPQVAQQMRELLGQDQAWVAGQLDEFTQLARRYTIEASENSR